MQLTLIILSILIGSVVAVRLVPHESAVERDTRTFLQAVTQEHR